MFCVILYMFNIKSGFEKLYRNDGWNLGLIRDIIIPCLWYEPRFTANVA